MRVPALGDRQMSVASSLIPVATGLAMTPILTRALGTTQFGLWATLWALLGSVQLVDLGVGSSLLRFMSVAQSTQGRLGSKKYLISAWLYYAVLAAICCVVALPWHQEIYNFVAARTPSPVLTIVLFFVLLAFLPIQNVSSTALMSVGDFKHTAGILLFSELVYALVIVLGAKSANFTVATVLIAQLCQVLIVFVYVWTHLRMHRANRLLTRAEFRQFGAFSSRVWLTNLSSGAVLQLPVIIVALMVAPSQVGVYGLAAMISLALRNFPLMSLAPVIRNLTGSVEDIVSRSRTADRTWCKTLTLYTGVGLVGILVGVPVMGGAGYTRAIGPCILLFIGYIIQLFGALATITSRQLELTKVEWRATAFGAAIHLILLWFAISALGLYGPGVVLIISQSVTLFFVRRQFHSFSSLPTRVNETR
jgi:O-antigen/teichoic acid export membrane protein